jgi:hypothetical protein
MKRLLLFLFIVFLFFQPFFGQNARELYVRVTDAETGDFISFVTVRIMGTNNGLIADYNGEFRLPGDFRAKDERLLLSSIGYRKKEVSAAQLTPGKINIIQLSPQLEMLETVVIKSDKKRKKVKTVNKEFKRKLASEIVREAIKRIPQNLASTPHSYIGYYRDYQIVDGVFHNLNEGILETFDKGIQTNLLAKNGGFTVLYDLDQNPNFIQDRDLAAAYNGRTKYVSGAEIDGRGGNEFRILQTHNPIRSYNVNTFSYVYNLERDFINFHLFRKEDVVYLEDEQIYIINFTMNPRRKSARYGIPVADHHRAEGSIYISTKDYAIHRFNYKAFYPGTRKVLFNLSIEYQRREGNMYLNYITFNNAFEVTDGFILKETLVDFGWNIVGQGLREQWFNIKFNRPLYQIRTETIKPENFSFKYGKKKLRTTKVEVVSDSVVKAEVSWWDGRPFTITNSAEDFDALSYEFKNIEDVYGHKLYKSKKIKADQFREFFVQRVNTDKKEPRALSYMNLNQPILRANLNKDQQMNQFWVNSPLMKKKYRDESK